MSLPILATPPICKNCGSPYLSVVARYCTVCQTFRNPARQWFRNFNANGWTAFLAVSTLTLASIVNLIQFMEQKVSFYPSSCVSHDLVVVVINRDPHAIVLSNAEAALYPFGDASSQKVVRAAQIAVANTRVELQKIDESSYVDSDFVASDSRSYVRLKSTLAVADVPKNAIAGDKCIVHFSWAYGFQGSGADRREEVGTCDCSRLA